MSDYYSTNYFPLLQPSAGIRYCAQMFSLRKFKVTQGPAHPSLFAMRRSGALFSVFLRVYPDTLSEIA